MKFLQQNKLLASLMTIMVALVAANIAFAESKSVTHATLSSLVFGPLPEGRQVTAISYDSDKVGSKVTTYGRTAATVPYTVTAAGSASQAVIALSATTGLASNDVIVVSGSGITPYKATLITVTSSNVTCSANLSSAVVAGYRVFEMTAIYRILAGSNTVTTTSVTGTPLVETPADSPVLIELDSTAASELSATVK